MIILAGLLAIVYGAVIGWLVRDIMAYRPPSRRKRIALNKYWQGWPAMIKDLRKVTQR
jgi:O-antigen/teichoic acid export membrane protein